MRIKVTENGPYMVTGGIPIYERIIAQKDHRNVLEKGRELPQGESYALCRCGGTKNAPFCDGTHLENGFDGTETASRKPYADRLEDAIEGDTMWLLDDGRCAFARFCHSARGDVWSLAYQDTDPENRADAIRMAAECPSGRLVAMDKDGNVLEDELAPAIIILQDPEKDASAGIFVQGPIVIEAADGTEYEVRNRVALCRCGHSTNKPFCDAVHVSIGYHAQP
ncbi:CDGSH iron-sulfur domain-containing protein [Eubacteriales bacterium OttesenSCG-928-M02]|nr:CDGSH iron-sulfur domain-containing protein [Eubacteriales bacterium OttesenSCG-928-M02]